MKNIAIVAVAVLGFSLALPVRAEELLKKGDKEYVGWELSDSFCTCRLEFISKAGGTIQETKRTCPAGPPPPSAVATIDGTVVSADQTTKDLMVRDDKGNEHRLFVPTSEAWALVVTRPGQKVSAEVNTKLGNRLESLKFPGEGAARLEGSSGEKSVH